MIKELSKLDPKILVDSIIRYAEYKVNPNFINSDRLKKIGKIILDTHIKILKYRKNK